MWITWEKDTCRTPCSAPVLSLRSVARPGKPRDDILGKLKIMFCFLSWHPPAVVRMAFSLSLWILMLVNSMSAAASLKKESTSEKQFLKQPFLNDRSYLREGTKSTSVGEERLGNLSLSDTIQTFHLNIPFKHPNQTSHSNILIKLAQNVWIII